MSTFDPKSFAPPVCDPAEVARAQELAGEPVWGDGKGLYLTAPTDLGGFISVDMRSAEPKITRHPRQTRAEVFAALTGGNDEA
jgi:hypothetical protein